MSRELCQVKVSEMTNDSILTPLYLIEVKGTLLNVITAISETTHSCMSDMSEVSYNHDENMPGTAKILCYYVKGTIIKNIISVYKSQNMQF